MRTYFLDIAKKMRGYVHGSEYFSLYISGEISDFCRFNHNRIRQIGSVSQNYVTLHLRSGSKSIETTATLSMDFDSDFSTVETSLKKMRQDLQLIPEDPHVVIKDDTRSSENIRHGNILPMKDLVGGIIDMAAGLDLVGILAKGIMYSGFADSDEQMNWSETQNFNFDYSLYSHKDKAVKNNYAGFDWDFQVLQDKISGDKSQLELLKIPAINLKPSSYRVYLSPRSVAEILSLLSWGGFSSRAVHGHQSSFYKLYNKTQKLNPIVSLKENIAGGLAPSFNQSGFAKPDFIYLIEKGVGAHYLVSPRSAKEFGEISTGANYDEIPESLDMAGGDLEHESVLSKLDTGLYISNLNYLNFSDRLNGKVTGLTRFATFYVENGSIKAPIEVLRFDDIMFESFGEKLLGLTRKREMIFSEITYFERSRQSAHVPGALMSPLAFTL